MGEAKRRAAACAGPQNKAVREHLARIIEDMARCAYEKQGEAAFECTERATSLHEAGHAIAIGGDPCERLAASALPGRGAPAVAAPSARLVKTRFFR